MIGLPATAEMHVGTGRTPHEPRLVQILVDIGEGSGTELIRIAGELAFKELVARRAGRSPPVKEVSHRPDGIAQRCERAACAGIHVGSKHPPDLRHGRNSRLFDHGSEIVVDDHYSPGACSSENRTRDPATDRRIDLLDQLLCEHSQLRLVVGQRWLRMGLHPVRLEGPDVAGHPGPTATVT